MNSTPAAAGPKKKAVRRGLKKKGGQKGQQGAKSAQQGNKRGQSKESEQQGQRKRQKSLRAQQRVVKFQQRQAALRRLALLGYHDSRLIAGSQRGKPDSKCTVCFCDVSNQHRTDHFTSEVHREALEFKKQCLWEGRHSSSLQEAIEKTDQAKAEWEKTKQEMLNQHKSSGKKAPSEGSAEKGAPDGETPDMESSTKEVPDVEMDGEAPDMESSAKEAHELETDGGAPNVETSTKDALDVETSIKDEGDTGTAPEEKSITETAPKEEAGTGTAPKEEGDPETAPKEEGCTGTAPKEQGNMETDGEEPNAESSNKEALGTETTEKESSNKDPTVKRVRDRDKFLKQVAFIGLEHVIEYLPNEKGQRDYLCRLCTGVFTTKTVFYHVQSIQHRVLYLTKHYKEMGIGKRFKVDTDKKYKQLVACSIKVEKKHGRKKIITVNKVYIKPDPKELQGAKDRAKALSAERDTDYRTEHLDDPFVGRGPGLRGPAYHSDLHRDPRYPWDAEFSRLEFAEAMRMERERLHDRGLSHRDIEQLIEHERLRWLESMELDEARLRRAFTDGRYPMSQEELMMRYPSSDGRYSMSREELMMRRHGSDEPYPMSQEEIAMRRRGSDGPYPMSREEMMMRRRGSDEPYPMSREEMMMRRRGSDEPYPMSQEEMMMRRHGGDGPYPMSQEDVRMRRFSSDGPYPRSPDAMMPQPSSEGPYQRSREQVLQMLQRAFQNNQPAERPEAAGLHHGFSDGRPPMTQQGAALCPPASDGSGRMSQEAATTHRGSNDGPFTASQRGARKQPAFGSSQPSAIPKPTDPKNSTTVPLALGVPSAVSQKLEALRRAVVLNPYTKGDRGKTFKELKAAYAAGQRGGKDEAPATSEMEDFWCNDELYDFLSAKERAVSPPAGAPPIKQARCEFSSNDKPLFPSASSMNPAPTAQAKLQMAMSFDSYRPAAPAGGGGQMKSPQGKPPQQREMYGASSRPQGFASSQQTFGPKGNTQNSFSAMGTSVGESRPALHEQQRATFNQPRPALNQSTWKQPCDQSGSSMVASRPPTNEARAPWTGKRSRFDQPPASLIEPRPGVNVSRQQYESRPAYGEMRSSLNEQRSTFGESRLPEPKPNFSESRPPESRTSFSGSSQPGPRKPYSGSGQEEPRQPYNNLRPSEQRLPYSESEPRQTYGESRPPEPRQPYGVSRVPEPRQPYGEPRQPYGVSGPPEPRQPYGVSGPPEPRQPYGVSAPPEPRQPYGVSGPAEPRQPYGESRPAEPRQLYGEPRQPYSASKPPDPRETTVPPNESRPSINESHLQEQRTPLQDHRLPPNQARSHYNQPRVPPNQSQPPYNEQSSSSSQTRPPYGTSDRFSGNTYSQNAMYSSSQYGNTGTTGAPVTSYGPATGGMKGYTNTYGYGYYGNSDPSYNSSYTTGAQSSYGGATSKPPEPQSLQTPGSIAPAYNMYQGQWSNQMPPRTGTYPPAVPGDGTSRNNLPTGY